MSEPQPDHSKPPAPPHEQPTGATSTQPGPAQTQAGTGPQPVPRTRWGAAWVGICAAALAAVALIVFMLQNTRPVEVTFLWMHGTLPLALALLIAGVGSVIVAMIFGVARITQLRKLARRRNSPDTRSTTSDVR